LIVHVSDAKPYENVLVIVIHCHHDGCHPSGGGDDLIPSIIEQMSVVFSIIAS